MKTQNRKIRRSVKPWSGKPEYSNPKLVHYYSSDLAIIALLRCSISLTKFKHIQESKTPLCYYLRNGHVSFHLMQSVNEIWILIKQLYFNAQKGPENKEDLARRLDNKILSSYGIWNHHFQQRSPQKLDLNFISLSRLTPIRTLNNGAQWKYELTQVFRPSKAISCVISLHEEKV